jgi:hypothetical protein
MLSGGRQAVHRRHGVRRGCHCCSARRSRCPTVAAISPAIVVTRPRMPPRGSPSTRRLAGGDGQCAAAPSAVRRPDTVFIYASRMATTHARTGINAAIRLRWRNPITFTCRLRKSSTVTQRAAPGPQNCRKPPAAAGVSGPTGWVGRKVGGAGRTGRRS